MTSARQPSFVRDSFAAICASISGCTAPIGDTWTSLIEIWPPFGVKRSSAIVPFAVAVPWPSLPFAEIAISLPIVTSTVASRSVPTSAAIGRRALATCSLPVILAVFGSKLFTATEPSSVPVAPPAGPGANTSSGARSNDFAATVAVASPSAVGEACASTVSVPPLASEPTSFTVAC